MVTSQRIAVSGGLELHALEWGADDPSLDHTVILVHGFLDIAWAWQDVVEAGLAGRFHVVAPDMRGHGDSDWIGKGGYYHFFDYLMDLHDLVGRLGRERVSLVGHSMGGSIASYYAGTYPDRVHRLALLEGTGPPETSQTGPERTAFWLESLARVRAREQRGYTSLEEAAARLRKNDPFLDEALALRLAQKGTRRGDDGRLRFKHDPIHATMGPYAFQTDVAMRFWRAVTCPVLLVEADRSAFRHGKEEAARRNGAFRDARLEILPGAGHMMHRHQPSALGKLLLDFLG